MTEQLGEHDDQLDMSDVPPPLRESLGGRIIGCTLLFTAITALAAFLLPAFHYHRGCGGSTRSEQLEQSAREAQMEVQMAAIREAEEQDHE
jgi:hypothetical protein